MSKFAYNPARDERARNPRNYPNGSAKQPEYPAAPKLDKLAADREDGSKVDQDRQRRRMFQASRGLLRSSE